MSNPGQLKRRLLIEAPVETPDGSGGVIRTYATAGAIWAAVTPLSVREITDAARLGVVVTHRIVLRMRTDLSNRHRLRLGARIFRIVTTRDQDGAGRFLEISAQEQTN
jgi:SPP1 family predicted phage head-tail adaptor